MFIPIRTEQIVAVNSRVKHQIRFLKFISETKEGL